MEKFYKESDLKKIQNLELDILKEFIIFCDKHKLTYFLIAGSALGAVRHKGFIPWDDDLDIGMPRKDYEKFLTIAETELTDKYYIINAEKYDTYPLLTTQLALKGTRFVVENFKTLNIPFGIYLDIFPFDNMCDNNNKAVRHARKTWFWGKVQVLSCIPKPYVSFKGFQRSCIWTITTAVYYLMKLLHIHPNKLYKKAKRLSVQFNGQNNKRINFFCDTNCLSNIIKLKELYPLKKGMFEGVEVNLPNKVEAHLTRLYGDYMVMPPAEKRKNHYPYVLDFGEYNEKE